MPTYEYGCDDCFKIIEIVQSIKDDAVPCCPQCGSLNFKRHISLPTIITKTKTSAIRNSIPDLIGGSGIDMTGRLDMPGRVRGIKRDSSEPNKNK